MTPYTDEIDDMIIINSKFLRLFSLCLIGLIYGCSVKFVADYDASIKEETVQIAKKVDLFWGTLLDTPEDTRQYEAFKARYNEIETDIRGLLMKNQIRALNQDSTRQVQILLDLWVEDRQTHKQENTFSDFSAKRHRKQFVRVFTAIARGEEAKNISPAAVKEGGE